MIIPIVEEFIACIFLYYEEILLILDLIYQKY